MKRTASLLLILLMVLAVRCSKKKSTQPEPEPDYTILATQTIGSEGDTLVISDFSLIVPPGAFASNAALKLYASSTDKPFANNGVTRTFRLEGLPAEYSEPLQVSIKYQGTLTNESFIAVGKSKYIVSADTLLTSYRLFSATDSSGYLLSELPARTAAEVTYNAHHFYARPKDNPDENIIEYILGITDESTYHRPGGHFNITCPTDLLDQVQNLAIYLDAAYDTAVAMGFGNVATEKLPRVSVHPLLPRSGCGYYYYCLGRFLEDPREGYFEFNQDSLAQPSLLPQMRITAGREFFRFVLTLCDMSIIPFPVENIPGHVWLDVPRRFWLHEAVVRWSEEKFTEDSNHIPSGFGGHIVLLGFNESLLSPPGYPLSTFGAGMTPVLKFLVSRYGQGFLVNICKEMGPEKNPIDEIIKGISDPEYIWLPYFFKEYVSGKIYGVTSGVFLKNKWGAFDIKSKSDTLKTFSEYYGELAAHIFVINLDYPAIDSSAKIRLQLSSKDVSSDYITILVFQLENDTLSYLGQGRDIVVEQLRELTDQGSDLLAVVVNSFSEPPYDDKEQFNIDLDMRVVTVPKPSFDWNWVSVNVSVLGHIEDSWGRQWDAGSGSGCGSHTQYGSFSGNTFTAFWDSTYYDYYDRKNHFRGNMTVTIDPATNTIISLHVIDTTQTTEYHHDTITCISSLAGSDIPFTNMGIWWADYQVLGTDACNHIDDLVQHTDYGDWWDEIKSYDCPSIDNFISVRFMKK